MRRAPDLPSPRGPLTEGLFGYLQLRSQVVPGAVDMIGDDPLADDDFQLALYCCYELHYRGFSLCRDFEWDPTVLRLRTELEGSFEDALRNAVSVPTSRALAPERELQAVIDSGAANASPSRFIEQRGALEHLREFAIHRSLYQLKEADCHTWAIPRYDGRSRSALIEIQMDEYGAGVPGRSHAELFTHTMGALGLDPTYGAYVDRVGAPTLATTNLVSWLGLHRWLLPALLGHLAAFEMTSVEPMGRYARACDRLGLPPSAREFYDVHVEADAHHGPLAAQQLVGSYLVDDPQSRPVVMWGAAALIEVERRFAEHLVSSWTCERSSLRAAGQPSRGSGLVAA